MKIKKIILMIRKKGNITMILPIFLLLVAIASIGYFYWQKQQKPKELTKTGNTTSTQPQSYDPNNGATWKTYQNSFYEIRYPWPWAKVEQQGTNSINGNTSATSIGPGDENLSEIRIWGYNISGLSLNEAFSKTSKDMIVKMRKSVKINGYPAIKYVLTNALMQNTEGNLGVMIKNPAGNGAYSIFAHIKYTLNQNGEVIIPDATTKLFDLVILNFRYFVQEEPPKLNGNSITVEIRNPYYSPNNEGILQSYEYTFSYDFREGDIVTLIKTSEEKYNLYTGIGIKRNNANLQITVPFEGMQITYDKRPDPIVVNNPNISKKTIYRIKYTPATPYDSPDYLYVSGYLEGTEKCGQSLTPLAACSNSSADTYGISCKANSEMVFHCDDIVKSLKIQSPKLRE